MSLGIGTEMRFFLHKKGLNAKGALFPVLCCISWGVSLYHALCLALLTNGDLFQLDLEEEVASSNGQTASKPTRIMKDEENKHRKGKQISINQPERNVETLAVNSK